ncbi:MAG: hypothetical protein SOW59_09300 [Corynebacterium sp.]|nr:hypothetical protein [Corynebacterium sp.]
MHHKRDIERQLTEDQSREETTAEETTVVDNKEPELPSFLSNPDKVDWCLIVALIAIAVYGFALIPLRAWLLTQPVAYTLMVGGYTSAVVSGANASAGNGHWLAYLVLSVIGAFKFVPIYYLMGRKWGKEFIDMSLAYMPRMRKLFDRTLESESVKVKAGTLAFLPLGLLPGPIPFNIVNSITGLIRIKFAVVAAVNIASIVLVNGIMLYLGYRFGEPVLDAVNVISRYMLWITLALIIIMVFQARRQMKRQKLVG